MNGYYCACAITDALISVVGADKMGTRCTITKKEYKHRLMSNIHPIALGKCLKPKLLFLTSLRGAHIMRQIVTGENSNNSPPPETHSNPSTAS